MPHDRATLLKSTGPAMAVLVAAVVLASLPVLAKSHHPAAPKPSAPAAPATPAVIATAVSTGPGSLPDMTLGPVNAPVTVVEYGSASCPHCAEWEKTVWPAFEAKYIATGKVHYVFREILTNPQEYALSAFLIGRCAVAQSRNPQSSAPYFAVLQSFFQGQTGYYQTGMMSPILKQVSAETGLSQKTMVDCVSDGPGGAAFMKNMETHAKADKVNETPTFFVNGKRMDGRELTDFDAAIAAAQGN